MISLVDCIWGPFGDWTDCSVSCGGGVKVANRTILQPALYGGKDCEGTAFNTIERCHAQPCPKETKPKPVDCEWSPITIWTECSKTCGWGIKTSERTISRHVSNGGKECSGDTIQTEKCKLRDCPGNKIIKGLQSIAKNLIKYVPNEFFILLTYST